MRTVESNICLIKASFHKTPDFEIVERKGIGHPDTLADALAEELSRAYSNYTLSNFGAILHHNFDKVGLLGGQSCVKFGEGYLTHPIRVLLNGRASTCFGDKKISVRKLLEKITRDFLAKHFPMIDREKDIEIHFNLSNASSPGKVSEDGFKEGTRKYWFEPRDLHDLRELTRLASNDTSVGCSYAPLTPVETLVLKLENYLNSPSYKKDRLWLGSDIKIMAYRTDNNLGLTICIPQIANYVPDMESYRNNLEKIRKDILEFTKNLCPNLDISLHINTRDDFECCELYLTAIGSSIESGDEGLVGRGNRINGLITPCNPMAIEGASGKNPVYHVGKLYNVVARQIARKLHKLTNGKVDVFVISQSGRSLEDPWKIIVVLEKNNIDSTEILALIKEESQKIPTITDSFLKGQIQLF